MSTETVQKAEVSAFSEPYERIDLPSKFIPYAEKELWVRPFNIGEVKKLQPILRGASKLGILDLLKGVISIDPKDLLQGDFWFILAWLRINTFRNAPIGLDWVCPSCGNHNTLNYDPLTAEIIELDSNYKEPAKLSLPSGQVIPVRLSRMGDEIKARDYVKTVLNKTDLELTAEDLFIPELAMTICDGQSFDKRIKLLESLEPEDLMIVKDFEQVYTCGLKLLTTDKCSEEVCGFVNDKIRLVFRVEDLIPEGGYRDYIRNAVRFSE